MLLASLKVEGGLCVMEVVSNTTISLPARAFRTSPGSVSIRLGNVFRESQKPVKE